MEADSAVEDDDIDAAQTLPTTLNAALEALQSDAVMVDALGGELVEWFVKIKREAEIAQINNTGNLAPFAVERELYFKFLWAVTRSQ